MTRGSAFLVTASLASVACGIGAVGALEAANDPPPDAASRPADGAAPNDAGISDDDATVVVVDEDAEAGPAPKPIIYLSNTTELWTFDPTTKTFAKVAAFTNCSGGIEEIAVDANGAVVATRADNGALFLLGGADKTTCAAAIPAAMPFALTFAPKGTLQASTDTLVGYAGDGDYLRYDRVTGASTLVRGGALGGYRPRGDVTFGPGGKGYVAAVPGNGTVSCPTDCLVEVDMTTGSVIRKVTEFPSGEVYAIAFSNGKVHGFAANAKVDIVTLDPLSVETVTPDGGVPSFRGGGASTVGF